MALDSLGTKLHALKATAMRLAGGTERICQCSSFFLMETVKPFLIRLQVWIWSLPQWQAIGLGLLAPIILLVSIALLGGVAIGGLLDTPAIGIRLGFQTRFLMSLFFWATVFYFGRRLDTRFFTRQQSECPVRFDSI